jgi:hypothetical protein
MFIRNLANFLRIPQDRIYIANIVAGTDRRRSLAAGGAGGSNNGISVSVMLYDDPSSTNHVRTRLRHCPAAAAFSRSSACVCDSSDRSWPLLGALRA